jgi:diketogulonate reductase-like aldo/keto reductase
LLQYCYGFDNFRSVGVSNFGLAHLEGLRKAGRPTPSVNQIELHMLQRHQDIVDYCREHGIAVIGYSPLAKGQKMNDAKLNALAARLVILFVSIDRFLMLRFVEQNTRDRLVRRFQPVNKSFHRIRAD